MPTSENITYGGQYLQPSRNPEEAHVMNVKLPVGTHVKGQVLGIRTSTTAADEVQTLTIGGSPTGGTYRIVFNGQVTSALNHNANAATIQAALEALSNIGSGNVAVAGSGPYTITFQGDLGDLDQPLATTIASLTGGSSPTATIALTTQGNPGGISCANYDDAASDGTQTAKLVLQYDTTVDESGNYTLGGGEFGERFHYAPAYYSGTFLTAELTGLDANGVADLGRLIWGTTTTGELRF